jgi:uncharacterized protein (DUF58 family)
VVTLAAVLLGISAALNQPTPLAWAGSLIVGLAIARTLTRSKIARARTAGFEMLWQRAERSASCAKNGQISFTAELRNRSNELLVLDPISPLCASELSVQISPVSAILPPHSTVTIRVTVQPLRVGLHGIQGLTVVVRDDQSAFEAQLTFANPIVIEAVPQLYRLTRLPLRGGRGRHLAPAEKSRPFSGESLEFREIRERQSGDPLRKIAWKASARRGILLVRDDEREQHHVVHFVLDASVELWAGRMGQSALDEQIDQLASTIHGAIRRGDRVGLTIVASRVLAKIEPDVGIAHERKLISALVHATTTRDHDRSGLDVSDVAAIILEHLRPIDPNGTKQLTPADLDAVARLAQRHIHRAPLQNPPEPTAPTPNERQLRKYLAALGLPSVSRTTTDRDATDRELLELIRQLIATRPDRIMVCSPWPSPRVFDGIQHLQRRLRMAHITLDWSVTDVMAGIPLPTDTSGQVVEQALRWHASTTQDRGIHTLRKLGIQSPQYIRFAPPNPPTTP